jgi:hypothetical protein
MVNCDHQALIEAKIFEKVIFDQTDDINIFRNYNLVLGLYTFYSHNPIYWILLTDDIPIRTINGLIIAILFIDLKKAFDTIEHAWYSFEQTLSHYGFSNKSTYRTLSELFN